MAEFKSMMAELKVMTRLQRAAAGIAAPPLYMEPTRV